ncbi:MAG: thioesterase family protein [Actinomycetota bacterium]|nr:thioesterase family protein [Actinomycetota bacterium]MDP2288116.1 thioesterase family protein [Actinomycetota bacterium]
MSTLVDILAMQDTGDDVFVTGVFDSANPHIYGGQLLAQALMAACTTVSVSRAAHSMHAYFVAAADCSTPVEIRVTRERDGRSVSARKMKVVQGSRLLMNALASFHTPEGGFEAQSQSFPGTNAPGDTFEAYSHPVSSDIQIVDSAPELQLAHPPRSWSRVLPELGSDQHLQACAMTYASDFYTGLVQFPEFPDDAMVTSIDHAIWFHRPFNLNNWHLMDWTGHSLSSGRGHYSGNFYDESGRMVASASQEMVVRRA